jgi:hypothetical protein
MIFSFAYLAFRRGVHLFDLPANRLDSVCGRVCAPTACEITIFTLAALRATRSDTCARPGDQRQEDDEESNSH